QELSGPSVGGWGGRRGSGRGAVHGDRSRYRVRRGESTQTDPTDGDRALRWMRDRDLVHAHRLFRIEVIVELDLHDTTRGSDRRDRRRGGVGRKDPKRQLDRLAVDDGGLRAIACLVDLEGSVSVYVLERPHLVFAFRDATQLERPL